MPEQEEASEQFVDASVEASIEATNHAAAHPPPLRPGLLGRWLGWTAPVSQAIAVSALLLGLANAVFAYCQTQEQREHDLRQELRATIQRLTETSQRLDTARASCTKLACAGVIQAVELEYLALARQGADLVDRVDASSAELRAVAAALSSAQDDSRALLVIRKAREVTDDAAERARAAQLEVSLLYLTDISAARALIEKTESEVAKASFRVESDRTTLLYQAELSWLYLEQQVGDCKNFEVRVKRLSEVHASIPKSLVKAGFFPTVTDFEAGIKEVRTAGGCPAPR